MVSVDRFTSTRVKVLIQRCLGSENMIKKSIHNLIVDADSTSFAEYEGEQRQSRGESKDDIVVIKNMQISYPSPSGCVGATQIKVDEFR